MKKFFESLGAPLRDYRRSWGAQGSDGTVFLREWEDRLRSDDDGKEYVIVARDNRPAGPGEFGWSERKRHIESIRSGARCFIVMLVPKDPAAPRRSIKQYNIRYIVVGGSVVTNKDGMTSIFVADRRPVHEFINPS